jgi:hypothetical protein
VKYFINFLYIFQPTLLAQSTLIFYIYNLAKSATNPTMDRLADIIEPPLHFPPWGMHSLQLVSRWWVSIHWQMPSPVWTEHFKNLSARQPWSGRVHPCPKSLSCKGWICPATRTTTTVNKTPVERRKCILSKKKMR